MSTSVLSPDDLIVSFTYPILQKVSEGYYNGYVQLRKEIKENSRAYSRSEAKVSAGT